MNEPRNPYAPPTSPVADRDDNLESSDSGRFIPNGRARPPGRGAGWIGDAWQVLKGNVGMWAAALILLVVAWIVLSLIPLLNIFMSLLGPFFVAAIVLGADEQRRTGTFELGVLWRAFEKKPGQLLAVGAISLLAGILIVVILMIFLGAQIFSMMAGGGVADPELVFSARFWLIFLFAFVLMMPVYFATYAAPALILLHDKPVIEALKMSFFGCLKNILPIIVFLICAFIMLIVASIPLLLGLLVALPILAITNYTAYRDIFVDDEA